MGGKPAIIANKINTTFYDGENYLEADVDISTSTVAKNILRVVKSYAKKIVFDLAWGFEGKVVEHLPEYVFMPCLASFSAGGCYGWLFTHGMCFFWFVCRRILGITRFERVHVDRLPIVPNEIVKVPEEPTP